MRRASLVAWALVLLTGLLDEGANAATPLAGGHYAFDTPQTSTWQPGPMPEPGPAHYRFPGEELFGAPWSLHVHSSGRWFTKFTFVEADLPCSRTEVQQWSFDLDGRTRGQAPMRIWGDGTFAALRQGAGSIFAGRLEKSTSDPVAFLDINGRFVTPKLARGSFRAWSSDGCATGWLPFRARYLKHGWLDLLDRT
jgi:hypothetical protein